jgi:Protein of unknown function (DUF3515)
MADATTRRAARLATLIALPVALLAGLIGYWALGGFRAAPGGVTATASASPKATGAVEVSASPLTGTPADVCRALVAKLPDTLGELARRPVRTGPEQNAAYGDPAVTVACGTPGPSVPPDGQLFVLDTVCWYAEQHADAAVWSLQDRAVPMTVRVPARYTGPSRFVIALSRPIVSAIPAVGATPTQTGQPSGSGKCG